MLEVDNSIGEKTLFAISFPSHPQDENGVMTDLVADHLSHLYYVIFLLAVLVEIQQDI